MPSCPTCGTTYPAAVRLCPKDGTVLDAEMPTAERFLGVVLDDKYRIDSYLSSGGMGAVFRATHVMLDKPVAVKLIKSDMITSPEMARRFQREARAATSLDHPNIVAVYDLGQTDDGTLYIAMELVAGRSLKDEIRQHGRIDPPRIACLLNQVASALALAHRQQIIHRDLKPQNVMLTRDSEGYEVAKLLDFGIAKTFGDAQTELTAAGYALGTPQYMSPEQAIGKDVDGRSDIYSLGVMLYEMLIGEVPFTDSSTPAILIKHMTELPAPPSLRRPDIPVPPHLEAISLKCLEKEPDRRYQTAEEFNAALSSGVGVIPGMPVPPSAPFDGSTILIAPTVPAALPAWVPAASSPGAPQAAGAMPAVPPVEAGTRPTAQAALAPEAGFTPRPGISFAALAAFAAAIALVAALGAALWLLVDRGPGDQPPAPIAEYPSSTAEQPAPATAPATALPATGIPDAIASAPPPPETGSRSAPSGSSLPPQPATAGSARSAVRPTGTPSTSPTPARREPQGGVEEASGGTAPRGAAASEGRAAAAQSPALPSPVGPARLPADPSVYVECRGAGEVCGAVRAAFDGALQRERIAIARSSDRADIVLLTTVTVIDERRDVQFGQMMAVRTYSIEVLGDVPVLDQVITMPSPRTFSFDQRVGAERAHENARVVAIDAVGRVRDFIRKEKG